MGTIEIVQEAGIKNALGTWTLIRPDNTTVRLEKKERYINEEAIPGKYTLAIENADGASATVELSRNGTVETSTAVPRVSFVLNAGDVIAIHAEYKFTIVGKVSVTSEPAGIAYTLRGPNDIVLTGTTPGSFEEAPRGLYSVRFEPPAGCVQPQPQSDTLVENGRVSFAITLSCEALNAQQNQEYERQLQFVTVTIGNDRLVFEDAPIGEWFAPFVYTVAKTSIMAGYKDADGNFTGRFGPSDEVSLAQLAKVAHEIAGIDETLARGELRNTTARGTWFEPYIRSAEQLHWQAFRSPRENLARPATRSEVVATLLQALDVRRLWPKGELFRDVTPETPYAACIETAAADGIVSSSNGAFRPDAPVNRAELAKMVSLAMETYLEDSPEIRGGPANALIEQ